MTALKRSYHCDPSLHRLVSPRCKCRNRWNGHRTCAANKKSQSKDKKALPLFVCNAAWIRTKIALNGCIRHCCYPRPQHEFRSVKFKDGFTQ